MKKSILGMILGVVVLAVSSVSVYAAESETEVTVTEITEEVTASYELSIDQMERMVEEVKKAIVEKYLPLSGEDIGSFSFENYSPDSDFWVLFSKYMQDQVAGWEYDDVLGLTDKTEEEILEEQLYLTTVDAMLSVFDTDDEKQNRKDKLHFSRALRGGSDVDVDAALERYREFCIKFFSFTEEDMKEAETEEVAS